MLHPQRSATALCITTVALALGPLVAHGSGFALLEQSATRLGNAFAGTAASADDATILYFNPAGIGRLERGEAILVGSGIGLNSKFHNQGSQPAFGQPLGDEGGNAGEWAFVPVAYVSYPIMKTLAVGVGLNVPFGLKTEYDAGWMGRFQALKSEIKTLNINPAIAWTPMDAISIGAGFTYQRIQAELTNDVNYSAVIAQGVQQLVATGQLPAAAAPGVIAANTGLQGLARVRGDDSTWGWNVGVLVNATPTTHIGLAYRSTLDYTVGGTIRFEPPTPTNPVGAGIVTAVSSPGAPLANGPATVDIKMPASALFSVRQDIGKFAVLLDVGWTEWSKIKELRVVRDTGVTASVTPELWHDAWRYALGGTYELSPSWTLRAGVAYDDSAVPNSTRTPRLPDTRRKWVAIGAGYSPMESLTIDFGYAHLFSDDVPLDQDAGNAAASGLLLGQQKSHIDIVAAQVVYRF